MHRALYRTYRPATFDDVAGQDHITSVLRYEVAEGRTSHAYLFCGSRGTGKTTCAKILSKAVNCLDPVNGNPCLRCANCRAIEDGTTTDVLEMDAASNTGVDYIRDIRDAVMYAPAMLKNRVYIIDEVHMLSDGAFNALLKTLEEPPSNVVFVLATTEVQKIPQTILSRCQRFEFRRIAAGVIAGRLGQIAAKEGIELDDDAAYLIARCAQGGMRDAISLLELCSSGGARVTAEAVEKLSGGSGRKTVESAVSSIADKDTAALFSLVADLYESSVDPGVFWQDLIAFYRDMIVYKTVRGLKKEELRKEILDLTEGEFERLAALSERFRYETLISHFGILDGAYAAASGKGGVSSRIAAEMALARLTVDRADNSPEALLERVGALEERLNALEMGRQTSDVPAAPAVNKEEPPPVKPAAVKREAPAPVKRAPEKAVHVSPVQKENEGKDFDFVEVLREFLMKEPSFGGCFADKEAVLMKSGDVKVFVRDAISLKLLESGRAGEKLEAIRFKKTGLYKRVVFIVEKKEETNDGQLGFDELFGN